MTHVTVIVIEQTKFDQGCKNVVEFASAEAVSEKLSVFAVAQR